MKANKVSKDTKRRLKRASGVWTIAQRAKRRENKIRRNRQEINLRRAQDEG